MLDFLRPGDVLMVTRIDRLARSMVPFGGAITLDVATDKLKSTNAAPTKPIMTVPSYIPTGPQIDFAGYVARGPQPQKPEKPKPNKRLGWLGGFF